MQPIAPYEVAATAGPSGNAAQRPRLLVVDDQPANIQALYQIFAADHQVLMATTGEQALALCISKSPDLVLLDVEMPCMGGYEVCRRLKAEAATHDIPIIFVTAHSDEAAETRGLDAGAVDFISKPINPAIVRARVKTHLTLKSQGDLLRKWVYVDAMTGVYNRRYFDERLEAESTRAMRAGSALSVVLMDVDFFKGYNDQYGHPAGDDALRRVAAAMKASLKRPSDLAARYGGEEFACLLPDTPLAGALKVAERVGEQVHALGIAHADSSVTPVITVSLGVGCKPAGASGSAEALLRLADAQLYLAKTSGRHRACGAKLGDA
jgi:diguanylate cyclase (GGDEF)-like protein